MGISQISRALRNVRESAITFIPGGLGKLTLLPEDRVREDWHAVGGRMHAAALR